VCDRLDLVENAPSPCAIIGKPAEIVATRKAAMLRPALASKLGVTLSFFCAETPSTSGTANLLEKHGVDFRELKSLKYRGNGWPGHFAPILKGNDQPAFQSTYRESWAQLQASRPWATQIWPDGSGELADISCGDPWYIEPDGKNPGQSLVIARTETGKRIVENAIRDRYLNLTPAEPWKITKSQEGLLRKKGAIWGRRLILSLFGLPKSQFDNLDLLRPWLKLPLIDKIRSTVGTARRVFTRGLTKRRSLTKNER
jgi:coenzyme F420 hydrogenase subunit beta